jgi:hypothetical protein
MNPSTLMSHYRARRGPRGDGSEEDFSQPGTNRLTIDAASFWSRKDAAATSPRPTADRRSTGVSMAVTTKSLLVLHDPRRMRVFRRRHGVFVPDLAIPAVNHELAVASLPQVPYCSFPVSFMLAWRLTPSASPGLRSP